MSKKHFVKKQSYYILTAFSSGKLFGCPECKVAFRDKMFVVIYKDAVECKNCGHIWVTYNEKLMKKYINKIAEEKSATR